MVKATIGFPLSFATPEEMGIIKDHRLMFDKMRQHKGIVKEAEQRLAMQAEWLGRCTAEAALLEVRREKVDALKAKHKGIVKEAEQRLAMQGEWLGRCMAEAALLEARQMSLSFKFKNAIKKVCARVRDAREKVDALKAKAAATPLCLMDMVRPIPSDQPRDTPRDDKWELDAETLILEPTTTAGPDADSCSVGQPSRMADVASETSSSDND